MRSLSPPTRPGALFPAFLALLAVMAIGGAGADPTTPVDEGRRLPWTTSGFAGTPDPPPPYGVEPAFPHLVFDRPVALVHAPGSHHLVVAELGGKVRAFENRAGAATAEVALDLAARGHPFGALYALAFHPRFVGNRQVFLCYALPGDRPDGIRVSRFAARHTDPLRIEPDSEEVILTYPSGGQNGGCLAFGLDDFLYIAAGDAAPPTPPDPHGTGQDVSDLLSSILRIDIEHRDRGQPYRIPRDNPFINLKGARPEVWAYGLRNPWRMSVDRTTGDLWAGDVGWELWESIVRVERGGNYGWSLREGRQTVRPDGRLGPTPILPTVVDHPHPEAASITGGYVYRGSRLADLAGSYVYGDYQTGTVWGLKHDGRRLTGRALLADTRLRLVSFGEDDAGELYLLDHGHTNQIYRLVANRAAIPKAPREFPRTLSRTGLFSSTRDARPAPGVLPYQINAEAWADGAHVERMLAIPGDGRIAVDPTGAWTLPEGSVLARTVSLDVWEGNAKTPHRQRVETQILHRLEGSWRPYTYVWDRDQADATLVESKGARRELSVADSHAPGGRHEVAYRVAARSECRLCHNPWVESPTAVFGPPSASPLALSAAQLDRGSSAVPTGENQLRRLERIGCFAGPLPGAERRSPRLVDPYDEGADLDARARTYLQVNCAHCHRPGAGGMAEIALDASLTLDETRTVGARPLRETFGIDDARIITPGEPERSVLYYRIAETGAGRMPRIGTQRVDERGARLIADWIAHLGTPAANPARPAADFPTADLAAQADAIRRMTASTREALGLVQLIDKGAIAPATLSAIVNETRQHPQGAIRDLFKRFDPEAHGAAPLGDVIEPGDILELAGDADRGRELFDNPVTQCTSCHRIGRVGGTLGPDLNAIGAKYDRPTLLGHILEPAQAVHYRYMIQVVEMKDGQTHRGMIVEDPPGVLVLCDEQNRTSRIDTTQIEQQSHQDKSLMPEGLLRDLKAQQAADLLAFLSSRKGPLSETRRGAAWRKSLAGPTRSRLWPASIAGWVIIGLGALGLSLLPRRRDRTVWFAIAALAFLFAIEIACSLRFALAELASELRRTYGADAAAHLSHPLVLVLILILLAAAIGVLMAFIKRMRRLATPCALSAVGIGVGLLGFALQMTSLPQVDRHPAACWAIWSAGIALALIGVVWSASVPRGGAFSTTADSPYARYTVKDNTSSSRSRSQARPISAPYPCVSWSLRRVRRGP